jgi:hypothetical protein
MDIKSIDRRYVSTLNIFEVVSKERIRSLLHSRTLIKKIMITSLIIFVIVLYIYFDVYIYINSYERK